jgi:hypothetical protein
VKVTDEIPRDVPEMPPDLAAHFDEGDGAMGVRYADAPADLDLPRRQREALTEAASSPWDGRVVLVPSEWYTTRPPARDWLLRDARVEGSPGVFPCGRVGLLVAEGSAGKTMSLAQLAVSLTTGAPWLGAFGVPTTGRVLLALGEETEDECHRRLYRAVGAMGCKAPDAGAVVCMPLAGVECALLESGEKRDPVPTNYARWLIEHVKRERYLAVLIDPHARFGGREAEIANGAATRAVQIYESIAATGAGVFIAHHTPQWDRRTRDPSTSSARGVTALTDGARWMMHMAVEIVANVEAPLREIVTASVVKSNYAKKPEPVVLRRDTENGGALVPLDDADREMIAQARATKGDDAKTERTERRAKAELAADVAAVAKYVTEHPGCTVRAARAVAVNDNPRRWERALDVLGERLLANGGPIADLESGKRAKLTMRAEP